MSDIQKIIKYFALALAVFLIVSIISTITAICMSIANIFDDNTNTNLDNITINDNIYILVIDTISSNIIIKQGDNLSIKTNNKYIKYNQDGKRLVIKEDKNWFSNKDEKDLIIIVPSHYQFDEVLIDNGAGQINIDTLTTKKLNFELGAGKVTISNLIVLDETIIEGGAGEIIISDAHLNNLNLDIGIGKVTIKSKITGISEINAGIGSLELNLIGNDYKIKTEKGIGSIKINDVDANNNSYYGNGTNNLNISGGIGNIKINTGD